MLTRTAYHQDHHIISSEALTTEINHNKDYSAKIDSTTYSVIESFIFHYISLGSSVLNVNLKNFYIFLFVALVHVSTARMEDILVAKLLCANLCLPQTVFKARKETLTSFFCLCA